MVGVVINAMVGVMVSVMMGVMEQWWVVECTAWCRVALWQTIAGWVPSLSPPQHMLLLKLGYPLKASGQMPLGQQSFKAHCNVVDGCCPLGRQGNCNTRIPTSHGSAYPTH
jgi:hypothetical protein